MNPFAIVTAAASAVPTVVAGIEYLNKEASSATKEQLAIDSLSVLLAGVGAAAPGAAPLTNQLNNLFSALIHLTVAGFNASGIFSHKPVAAQPAPAGATV